MNKIRLTLLFTMIFVVGILFSQTVGVAFKDPSQNTLNLVRQEDPDFPYPTETSYEDRWMVQLYKSVDDVIDPLGPDGLPTGDDIISHPASPADGILYLLFGPTGGLNISGYTITPSTGYYDTQQGDKVYLRLFNAKLLTNATKYIVFNGLYTIPTTNSTPGIYAAPINGWSDWITIAPAPTTHIISGAITSQWDLSEVAISATDILPADITYAAGAYTVTVPDGWDGTVTPSKTGYIFEPESRTYTDVTVDTPNQDFVMKTVVVPGVPANLSPNQTTLTFTEPTAVTLTWDAVENAQGYRLIWNNGEIQDLPNVLSWTTPTALGAGTYTWKVCAYNNLATKKINTPVRVQMNGRSTSTANSPKADGGWAEASFIVEIETIPQNYTVAITSVPVGAAIYVGGVDTGEITPYTFTLVAGSDATYTVVMDHYTWVPDHFEVINISDDMNCNFLGTPYFDLPDGTPFTPPDAPLTLSITVTGGNANFGSGVLPGWPNSAFTPVEQYFLDLLGAGPWIITFNTTALWGAYYYGGIWNAVQNQGTGISFTIYSSKGENAPVVLGNEDPTLPVELSYFAATLTAENFVNIAWTTQTETNMNGFNIYRNDSDNLASAIQIAYIPATNTSTTQNYKHIDREVENGNTYYYWLECVETNGESTFNGSSPVYVDGPTTPELPNCTTMNNAYPNPFRAGEGTTIKVNVKAGDNGTVTIYNILGQVVKTFPVNQGSNNLTWNARDSKGNLCGNGIYFYKLSTNSRNQTKKMVIVK